MRKRKAYVVYDMVAEVYSEWLFPAMNEMDAIRAFTQSLLQGDDLRKQDVVLYEIGEYDRIDGKLTGYDIPRMIVSGIDCLRDKEVTENE